MDLNSLLDFISNIIILFLLFIAWIILIAWSQDLEVEHCIEFYDEHNNYVLDGCEVYIEKYKENLKGSD